MQWYYADADEQQIGPLSVEEFDQAVTSGTITPATLVWNEGLADWQPLSAVQAANVVPAINLPGGQAECYECRNTFPEGELVEFEGKHVCAGCKPAFFQRLSEGGIALSGGGSGQTANADLTAAARACLSGLWGLGVGFNFLYNVLVQAMQYIPYVGGLGIMICAPALSVGNVRFHVAVARGDEPRIGMMFDGFKVFGTALLAGLLMGVYILLWTLLLIVPGIMASYSYMMVYYILSDDPTITASEALRRSKQIMYGNRMKLFCLTWRFFGWGLLSILTLGIGLLWLIPYMNTSMALFYEDVRGLAQE